MIPYFEQWHLADSGKSWNNNMGLSCSRGQCRMLNRSWIVSYTNEFRISSLLVFYFDRGVAVDRFLYLCSHEGQDDSPKLPSRVPSRLHDTRSIGSLNAWVWHNTLALGNATAQRWGKTESSVSIFQFTITYPRVWHNLLACHELYYRVLTKL